MGCSQSTAAPAAAAKSAAKEEEQKEVKGCGLNHSQFIIDNSDIDIMEVYDLQRQKLGEGSYGHVCKGVHKSTGAVRAVKTISKSQLNSKAKTQAKLLERLKHETEVMKMMDHPNIVKLFETYDDRVNIYLVMELCAGGELFDKILETGHFTEVQAAIIMRQVVRAVHYMHEQHVCHRDLKPENFLFVNDEPIENNLLKIIDFGLSTKYEPDQVLKTKMGTPYYVAPQVTTGNYDELCDLWSCGVIMFVMLAGYPPFTAENDKDVIKKVRKGNYCFRTAEWQNLSPDSRDLVKMLLKLDPKDRFNAEKALNHTWIKNCAPKSKNVSLQGNFVDNLRGFRNQNKFKKAALHVIAGQLNDDQISSLREMFLALDDNGDGQLTAAEIREGMEKSGLKDIPPDLQNILEGVDADGSGVIDYTEFLAATLDKRAYLKEDVMWSAFRMFDKDGNGEITPDELKAVLQDEEVQEMAGAAAMAELMLQVDSNGDGVIDFEEFMEMMKSNA